MKKTLLALAMSAATLAHADITTDEQKIAYSLGVIVGERIAGDFGELDYDAFLEGIKDAANPEAWQLSREEIGATMQMAQQQIQARQQQAAQDASAETRAEGEAFLAEFAQRDGVTVTESGLHYRYLAEGEGASPAATSRVRVHYTGTLIDGTVFDSSVQRGEPVEFQVNQLIPGWVEALQLMKVGDKLEIAVPFDIAYGPAGAPPNIPPFATLVFEMELLAIVSE